MNAEPDRPSKSRMTTNKRKATNFYTTAVSLACYVQRADAQNVKNRNRERTVPKDGTRMNRAGKQGMRRR